MFGINYSEVYIMTCDFWSLLADNLDIVLSCVVGLLCFMVTLFRTGSVKKSILQLKEFEEMIKYKTAEKQQAMKVKGQEFSETIKDYILDPVTNELEESPVPKNVQEEIQSYIDVALDRALERFLPNVEAEVDDVEQNYTEMSQDLASIGDAFDLAEEYREKLGLGADVPVAEVFNKMAERAETLKQSLLSKTTKKEEKQNVESEKKETEQML
ncbi:hypothetical protein [Microvirus mar8]|uniref:Uncharacterized protein n=1 Tax=Microvirus mar8 TaxID=2851204 RepID=A0A8F5XR93_9VIRU|nr:hypothetical protein [Microvirus mar8]